MSTFALSFPSPTPPRPPPNIMVPGRGARPLLMLGGGAILPKFIPLLGLSGHVHDHFLALHMDLRLLLVH